MNKNNKVYVSLMILILLGLISLYISNTQIYLKLFGLNSIPSNYAKALIIIMAILFVVGTTALNVKIIIRIAAVSIFLLMISAWELIHTSLSHYWVFSFVTVILTSVIINETIRYNKKNG